MKRISIQHMEVRLESPRSRHPNPARIMPFPHPHEHSTSHPNPLIAYSFQSMRLGMTTEHGPRAQWTKEKWVRLGLIAFDFALSRDELEELFDIIDTDGRKFLDWPMVLDYLTYRQRSHVAGFVSAEWNLQAPPAFRQPQDDAHFNEVLRTIYVPELDLIVTTGRDSRVKIWRAGTLALKQTLIVQGQTSGSEPASVVDAAYIPDQQILVVAATDATLNFYALYLSSFKYSGRCGGHTEDVGLPTALSWYYDEADKQSYLLFGDMLGSMGRFVGDVKMLIPNEEASKGVPTRLMDRRTVADGNVDVFERAGHFSQITGLVYCKGMKCIYTASLDGSIRLFDVVSKTNIAVVRFHTKGIVNLAVSRDGSGLACSTAKDRKLIVWRASGLVTTGTRLLEVELEKVTVGLELVIETNQVILLHSDRTMTVWNIKTGKCTQTFLEKDMIHRKPPAAICFDPSRLRLVSVAQSPEQWPLRAALGEASGHTKRVKHVSFSPSFGTIFSGKI